MFKRIDGKDIINFVSRGVCGYTFMSRKSLWQSYQCYKRINIAIGRTPTQPQYCVYDFATARRTDWRWVMMIFSNPPPPKNKKKSTSFSESLYTGITITTRGRARGVRVVSYYLLYIIHNIKSICAFPSKILCCVEIRDTRILCNVYIIMAIDRRACV